MIRRILFLILANGLIIYLIASLGPVIGLKGLQIEPLSGITIPVFFVLGAVFWVCYDIIRKIIRILAFPLSLLTLGAINWLITLSVIHMFARVINSLDTDISVTLGQRWEVILVAFVISILGLFIK